MSGMFCKDCGTPLDQLTYICTGCGQCWKPKKKKMKTKKEMTKKEAQKRADTLSRRIVRDSNVIGVLGKERDELQERVDVLTDAIAALETRKQEYELEYDSLPLDD